MPTEFAGAVEFLAFSCLLDDKRGVEWTGGEPAISATFTQTSYAATTYRDNFGATAKKRSSLLMGLRLSSEDPFAARDLQRAGSLSRCTCMAILLATPSL
jgi:hypothetical protein